jgi:hypothetical protein
MFYTDQVIIVLGQEQLLNVQHYLSSSCEGDGELTSNLWIEHHVATPGP